ERPFDRLIVWPDSKSYTDMADLDLLDPAGLTTLRPWGYPVLLKLYRLGFGEGSGWTYLPTCHLLLHVFSVLVFYAGLRQLRFPVLAGVLMCVPVLHFDYFEFTTYSLLADTPGQAFLLLTVSSFFFVLRKPTRLLRWECLALCVFASYQIRAAFQFLL